MRSLCKATLILILIGTCAVSAKKDEAWEPEALVKQALEYRDKVGSTTREQKLAAALLTQAARLVSHKTQEGKDPKAVPVPGFPDLAFAADGHPAALRELAKSHQRGKGVDVNHKLSLELFRRAAELGDPEAQGAMGLRMSFGLQHPNSFEGSSIRHFGRPDEGNALLHYYFGAAGGDPFSRTALGYRHTFGLGVPKSCWSAVSYYKPVAEAVVQEAVEASKANGAMGSTSGRGLPQIERIRLNVHANQGLKPDRQREVLQYYQYSADRGNIDAQAAVGTLLHTGMHGVTRDPVAASHYLQRAAAAGNDEAMAHLGHMHGAGMGVPQDLAKALKYFRQAAMKKNPLGLYGLGYMYMSGKGVEQDHEAALKHFQSAAEQGDRDAHFYLGAMHMHGLGMKRRSLSKAFMHYFQAASLGHVEAAYNTAMMHLAGKGTAKACKPALSLLKALAEKGPLAGALQAGHEAFFRGQHSQALLLYLQASEMGMEVAQSNAAWMLDRGFAHAGPQAAHVATTLFRRSAEQGNVMSLLQLGDCYYHGSGVEQDWTRAAAIYYEAYKERSAEAMFNLGFMHEFGAGVPQDMELAKRFYNMAKHSNADAALPVYLANAWLRAHITWDWMKPKLPAALQAAGSWLFELRPIPGSPAARAEAAKAVAVAAAGGKQAAAGQQPVVPGDAGKLSPALPSAGSTPAPPAGTAKLDASSSSGSSRDYDDDEEAEGSSWLWWLSPQLLAWQWDGLVWRIAEATGLGGVSITQLMEEYSDVGETLLLFVLMCVLLMVLRIRRQRQQALENQVLLALAQPQGEEAQLAQQIAAQIGMQIPAGPAATAVRGQAAAVAAGDVAAVSSRSAGSSGAESAAVPAVDEVAAAAAQNGVVAGREQGESSSGQRDATVSSSSSTADGRFDSNASTSQQSGEAANVQGN